MVALVDLQLYQDLLCTAKLNWTDLTCGLPPPSLKTRLTNSRQLCGGKFRGHPQTPSYEVRPTRCRWEAARRCFLLVLQSLCMDLQNSNGKWLNLVFLKNCSMLILKLENLIQNLRALIAVWLLVFNSGARACYSLINIQNWIHKQNFVEFRSKLLEHERFEVCIS